MAILFTPSARRQFLAALDYIRRENPAAAARLLERSARALRRLEKFPSSGRVLPEFPDLPYREVIVTPYRFFYRTGSETLWILAVWHGAQVPAKPRTPGRGQKRG